MHVRENHHRTRQYLPETDAACDHLYQGTHICAAKYYSNKHKARETEITNPIPPCPMLLFTDPMIISLPFLSSGNTEPAALASIASPTTVPVPCNLTKST